MAARRQALGAHLLEVSGLPAATVDRLVVYLDLVARWRDRLDLVGSWGEQQVVDGPLRESLAGLSWLPLEGRLLDIGSGVGLPAIPLLIVRMQLSGVLLEPRERRWAFLREVVRELGLSAEVRRESLSAYQGGECAAVTVRGVGAAVWTSELVRVVSRSGVVLWWTSEDKAAAWVSPTPAGRVIISALPSGGRTKLLVWQLCST
jgi:16S rRNA G527 N7-methylase RsmG